MKVRNLITVAATLAFATFAAADVSTNSLNTMKATSKTWRNKNKNVGWYDIATVQITKVAQADMNVNAVEFMSVANDCSATAEAPPTSKDGKTALPTAPTPAPTSPVTPPIGNGGNPYPRIFDAPPVPGLGADLDLNAIINLGQKLWQMIQANKAVVTTKTQTANALPSGLKCWDQLENWKAPRAEVYRVSYKNGFGFEVVNLEFALVYSYGGQVNGVGAYLTNATIQYRKLDVSWGFNVDASVEIPMVTNVGKSSNPVAGMELTLRWKIDSLSHTERTASFFVFGDGRPTQLL